MNGIEAARDIKSRPAGSGTVIIALTGDVMNDHPKVALENDLNDFIWKPCPENELLEKISRHLGLAYIYDDERHAIGTVADLAVPSGEPEQAELKELPADLIRRLHRATFNGDKALLDELIPMIGERGDSHSARTLQELADTYQYDRLIELLERACPQ
jgi:Amt family ammonium transporter